MVQEQPGRVGRRLSAIVAADVAGYSRLMGLDEAGTARILREHRVMAVAVVANVAALHHCNSARQGVTLEPDCGGLRGSTQHFILERKAEVASSTPAFAMNRRS